MKPKFVRRLPQLWIPPRSEFEKPKFMTVEGNRQTAPPSTTTTTTITTTLTVLRPAFHRRKGSLGKRSLVFDVRHSKKAYDIGKKQEYFASQEVGSKSLKKALKKKKENHGKNSWFWFWPRTTGIMIAVASLPKPFRCQICYTAYSFLQTAKYNVFREKMLQIYLETLYRKSVSQFSKFLRMHICLCLTSVVPTQARNGRLK